MQPRRKSPLPRVQARLGVSLIGQHAAALSWPPALSVLPVPAQGLFSSVVCPGTMLTNLTYGILPPCVWTLLMPFIWLVSARLPGFSFPHVQKQFHSGPESCV